VRASSFSLTCTSSSKVSQEEHEGGEDDDAAPPPPLDDGNSTHNDDDEFILSLKLSWGVKAVVGGEIHFSFELFLRRSFRQRKVVELFSS
jgi:hypothetical protein